MTSTFVHYMLIAAETAAPSGVEWGRVLDAHIENGQLVVALGPLALLSLLSLVLAWTVWRFWLQQRLLPDYEVVEAELAIAKIGKITIRPNRENIQIAHQAWVELTTRKAALPFENDDVIVEVYDSYYQLFGRLRDLTKAIPAHKLRKCPDTKKLVAVMIRVLNRGLRPHLTRWQARFRRWYDEATRDQANRGKSPQDVQKGFPEFDLLVADLKSLQNDVVLYGEFLRQVAQGNDR